MTVGHLLAGLVFAGFFAAGYRALSWFFRGTKVQDDEPVTGYADPAHYGGRPRW